MPGGPVGIQSWALPLETDSVGLEWGLKISMSSKSQVKLMLQVWRITPLSTLTEMCMIGNKTYF